MISTVKYAQRFFSKRALPRLIIAMLNREGSFIPKVIGQLNCIPIFVSDTFCHPRLS